MARQLVETYQAACVNVYECRSFYQWDGKFQDSKEWSLVIKTAPEKCREICETLVSNHPYQTPAILYNDQILGLKPFVNWMKDQLKIPFS